MLQAMLHGKLSRQQENMEDLLTSQVFGTFRYSAPHAGLLPWLRRAEDLGGQRPLLNLPDRCTVEYEFWPHWAEPGCSGCEPDAVLRIAADDLLIIVAVEAKHLSGKSSEADETVAAPADQLAREWDNLTRIADQNRAQPVLLYVTADYAAPRADMESSINEYRTKRATDAIAPNIYWLSWRHLAQLFRGHAVEPLRDLAEFATRLDLRFFDGVRVHRPPPKVCWQFTSETVSIDTTPRFSWTLSTPVPTHPWRFTE